VASVSKGCCSTGIASHKPPLHALSSVLLWPIALDDLVDFSKNVQVLGFSFPAKSLLMLANPYSFRHIVYVMTPTGRLVSQKESSVGLGGCHC
jgi:hypothetical protein